MAYDLIFGKTTRNWNTGSAMLSLPPKAKRAKWAKTIAQSSPPKPHSTQDQIEPIVATTGPSPVITALGIAAGVGLLIAIVKA